MAQNIIVAWLCGARFIELKTVQTLDELEIPKPCIDVEDEGYNIEWSQELKVRESYEEYLRAWVIIHALHQKLGFSGEDPGTVFNLSVGYDHAGLQQENMKWYLRKAKDAGEDLERIRASVRRHCPEVDSIQIPSAISNSVTLSTMHGCPPNEIGILCHTLMEEYGLHTSVKLNPTLLGPARLRGLLNDSLGFSEVEVPDEAFGHDLKWEDALPLLRDLIATGERESLVFGVKLSNTLEVKNHRQVFEEEASMMYLSGRPLSALTVTLAELLQEEFKGELYLSYAGGADAFNVAGLLRAGLQTITVCSDLLKSGGYLRLLQYLDKSREAMQQVGAENLVDFVLMRATRSGVGAEPVALKAAQLANLREVAKAQRESVAAKAGGHLRSRSKTQRPLGLFDCIEAPCVDSCAIDQKVPAYLRAVATGRDDDAVAITLEDNAMASSLGRACDHKCELSCVRTHYDEPVAIRQIKRFIMEHEGPDQRQRFHPSPEEAEARQAKVAIVGAGPAGISAATFLARAGYPVTLFEAHDYAGGMVSGTIPVYRTPEDPIAADLARLMELSVELKFGQVGGRDFCSTDLRASGFEYQLFAAGAQRSVALGLPNEEADGILPGLEFLREARHGEAKPLGSKVLILGGGDVAMDCARTALRLPSGEAAGQGEASAREVRVIYRRTRSEMPGQKEEVDDFIDEGGLLEELLAPKAFLVEAGRVVGLECEKMRLGARGKDGRRAPEATGERTRLEATEIILAIGQAADLSFFGDLVVQTTRKGLVVVEAETGRTNLEGVYAAGDVVNDGPDSIVAALEEGRRVAMDIRKREEAAFLPTAPPAAPPAALSQRAELLKRRATRQPREKVPHLPPSARTNFQEVVLPYTEDAARAEAARCLDCDSFCSLCVSVCPNLAFFTYELNARPLSFPKVRVAGGRYLELEDERLILEQGPQVAVVTDFCNECGNCTTFCPTSGAPYKDKPRIYLAGNREDFEAERENAFYAYRGSGGGLRLLGRFEGETHELSFGSELRYLSPSLQARLRHVELSPQQSRLMIVDLKPNPNTPSRSELSLRPAGILFALGSGLSNQTHLPFA